MIRCFIKSRRKSGHLWWIRSVESFLPEVIWSCWQRIGITKAWQRIFPPGMKISIWLRWILPKPFANWESTKGRRARSFFVAAHRSRMSSLTRPCICPAISAIWVWLSIKRPEPMLSLLQVLMFTRIFSVLRRILRIKMNWHTVFPRCSLSTISKCTFRKVKMWMRRRTDNCLPKTGKKESRRCTIQQMLFILLYILIAAAIWREDWRSFVWMKTEMSFSCAGSVCRRIPGSR